jgi:cytochrome c
MYRILLPVLASFLLTACGEDAGSTATDRGSADARSVATPASSNRLAEAAEPAERHEEHASNEIDLANGQRQFRRCQACHTIVEGGRHTVGPNLYGVIGHPAASASGFSYSQALSASGLIWDRETLDEWIENPRELVPGNRMSFVGLRDEDDRRDVIAYLASVTAQED